VAWRRILFDWEAEEENHLMYLLDDKVPCIGSEDLWVWKAGEDQTYTVSSAYRCLRLKEEGAFRSLYEAFWSI